MSGLLDRQTSLARGQTSRVFGQTSLIFGQTSLFEADEAEPAIAARAGAGSTGDQTSHPITLPAFSAGQLLAVVFTTDGIPTLTVSAGTGWTKLGEQVRGTVVKSAVWWKVAAGGDALTIDTSAAERTSHASFAIDDATTLEGANASSINVADPPALTPSGGAIPRVWIASRSGDALDTVTGAPAGYGNLQNRLSDGLAGTGCATAAADKVASTASDDPAAFTVGDRSNIAWTLAVW